MKPQLLSAPRHPALTVSQGCITQTYFYLLYIQNCAASSVLQVNLYAAGCCLKLSCATGTHQGCLHPAQVLFYHDQVPYTGSSQSPGPSASPTGPLPWHRLYFSLVDMSSRAAHQTKTGSDLTGDPFWQSPC